MDSRGGIAGVFLGFGLLTASLHAGMAWLSWQTGPGCTRTVKPADPGYVEVEEFCRYWNSSAGDCTRRRHRVRLGLFLGPAEGPFLPCG